MIGQAIAAVSTPLGIAAGIAGAAAPGASETAKSLSLAGVGLNTAAQGLQAAAAAQLSAAGMGGLIGRLLPGLGLTGTAIAGVGALAYAKSQGMGEQNKITGQLDDARANLKAANEEIPDLVEGILANQKKLGEIPAGRTTGDVRLMLQNQIKADQARLEAAKASVATNQAAIAALETRLATIVNAKDPMFPAFWNWLEQSHKAQEQQQSVATDYIKQQREQLQAQKDQLQLQPAPRTRKGKTALANQIAEMQRVIDLYRAAEKERTPYVPPLGWKPVKPEDMQPKPRPEGPWRPDEIGPPQPSLFSSAFKEAAASVKIEIAEPPKMQVDTSNLPTIKVDVSNVPSSIPVTVKSGPNTGSNAEVKP